MYQQQAACNVSTVHVCALPYDAVTILYHLDKGYKMQAAFPRVYDQAGILLGSPGPTAHLTTDLRN
jgi:hypothetical protein